MTTPATPHPRHQETDPAMNHPDIIWATGPDILNPEDRDQLWDNLTTDQEDHQ